MIAKRDHMPVILEDESKGYKVWSEITDEGPKTVVEYRAEGVTPNMYQGFSYNVVRELPKVMTNFTIKPIVEEEGEIYQVVHHHIKTPFIVSNRSIFPTYYHVHSAELEGEYTFITSSAGNDTYVEENFDLIGSDVIADMHLNYVNVKPIHGGINIDKTPIVTGISITQCLHVNLGGTMPAAMRKKISEAQAKGIVNLMNHILKSKEYY